MYHLKQATKQATSNDSSTYERVQSMLTTLAEGREEAAKQFAAELDGWTDDIVVPRATIDAAINTLPESLKSDIQFAHQRVRDFATAQRDSIQEFEVTLMDGLVAGQRLVPVTTAGCYVPGGRYAHVASAIMSITTARVAGVEHVIASTPANPNTDSVGGIHPGILYAMDLCGCDTILALGGVQGVAALAYGLFTGHEADIIVGPGNRFVAEAKRILFGRVGIDVLAGPTESLIIADEHADPAIIASDLVGQAEHGPDSPVWLVTLDEGIGQQVLNLVPGVIEQLPDVPKSAATAAWRDYAEVVVAESREEACQLSDGYAPEHLHVQAEDLDWWLANLRNYGSLFLGEETTVAFGDKCSGPNHILPTKKAARYSGGLNVHKFVKSLTYQRMTRDTALEVAPVSGRISRLEGMEAHARTSDIRVEKYKE
ncbi:MAG: histidinol dehydrogenase [Chloroflexota bacterium]